MANNDSRGGFPLPLFLESLRNVLKYIVSQRLLFDQIEFGLNLYLDILTIVVCCSADCYRLVETIRRECFGYVACSHGKLQMQYKLTVCGTLFRRKIEVLPKFLPYLGSRGSRKTYDHFMKRMRSNFRLLCDPNEIELSIA